MKSKDAPGSNTGEKGVSAPGKQKKEKQKGTLTAEQMISLQSELDRTGVTIATSNTSFPDSGFLYLYSVYPLSLPVSR